MGFKEKGKFESIFDPQIQKMKYKIILKWFFPVLLLLIAYKVQKPHYNWDVVFYCGAIFNDTQHPEASRIAVIQAMKNSPFIDYNNEILPKTQYGKDVFSNNQSYEEQYAFYNIRVVYIKTIQLFHAMGIDAVYSVYLASLFYALATVLAVYFFCFSVTQHAFFSFIVALFVILQPGFKEYITSSPDTLSAFSLILAIIAYFSGKKWLIYSSVIFSIICRTDNIIFIGALYGLTLIQNTVNKKNLRVPLLCLAISLVAFFVINSYYHNAGYRVLYYHTFIEHLSFPLTQPVATAYTEIWRRLIPEIPYFLYPAMYLAAVIIIARGSYKTILSQPAMVVAIAAIITFVVRFSLFPLSHPRFIFQYEFIGILAIVYYFRNSLYLFFNPEKREI